MHSVLRRANYLPEYSNKMSASGKRQRIANLRQKRDKVAAAVLTMRLQREMARLKEDVQTSQEVFGEQAAAAAAQMQELRAEIVRIKEKKEAAVAQTEREANELEYWDRNEECVIRRAGGKFRFDKFGFCADRTNGRKHKFGNYKMTIKYVQHVRLEHDGLTAEVMLDGRRVLVRRASVPEREELRRTRAHYQEQLDIKRADKRNLTRAQKTEYMRRWRENRNRVEVGGMEHENEVNFEQLFDNADDENDMAVDLPDGVGDHQVDLLEVAVLGDGDKHEEDIMDEGGDEDNIEQEVDNEEAVEEEEVEEEQVHDEEVDNEEEEMEEVEEEQEVDDEEVDDEEVEEEQEVDDEEVDDEEEEMEEVEEEVVEEVDNEEEEMEEVDEENVETPVLDLSNRPDLVTRAEMDPAVEYICARHNLPVNGEGLCVQGVERESSVREENKVSCLDKVSGPSSKVEGEVTLDEVVNRSGMNKADGHESHESTIEAMEQKGEGEHLLEHEKEIKEQKEQEEELDEEEKQEEELEQLLEQEEENEEQKQEEELEQLLEQEEEMHPREEV